jgi:hypothetical protein
MKITEKENLTFEKATAAPSLTATAPALTLSATWYSSSMTFA